MKSTRATAANDSVFSDTREYAGSIGYGNLLLTLLTALVALRWMLIGRFELTGDEAYYWQWAQHLDWSYYSKGPGVALVIAAGSTLLGDTVLGVRVFTPLFIALAAWGVFVLGGHLFDRRIGFWSAILLLAMPLTAVGGMLQTIDPISVCLWVWSLVALTRVLARQNLWNWLLLGLLIGIGALAKYTNLMLLPGMLLFLFWSRQYRGLLTDKGFWLMLLCAALCLSPVLVWQAQHDWITLTHLHERGALNKPLRLSIREFLEFLGLQLAVSWPVLPAGLAALYGMRQEFRHDPRLQLLLCMSVPLWGMYALMAWVQAGEANWTAPAYVAASILAVRQWLRWRQARSPAARLILPALLLAAALQAVITVLPFSGIGGSGLQSRMHGAAELSARVRQLQVEHAAQFVIGDHYQTASLLAFYLPRHPPAFTPTTDRPRNQLYFWPDYVDGHRGHDALYVSRRNEVPAVLRQQFTGVELLQVVTPGFNGRKLRPYYVFVCRHLSGSYLDY